MAREDIKFKQTVAILVDGNNIERSIHNLTGSDNSMVNFDTLVPRLLNARSLNRFIYFREGHSISEKLAERLHEHYYGIVVPCHKSADIPLSIYATQIADKVDTVIILSGDSDYVELVRHLRSRGVRVEIASVEKTTAEILRRESDYWHPIVSEDCFELKSGSSSSKQTSRKGSGTRTSSNKTPEKSTSTGKKSSGKSTSKSKSTKAKSSQTASKKPAQTKDTKTKKSASKKTSSGKSSKISKADKGGGSRKTISKSTPKRNSRSTSKSTRSQSTSSRSGASKRRTSKES